VNTRENLWNVYCCATNQKRDETAAWISHDLIQNNELGFSNTEIVLFVFQLIYVQRIDINDMFSDIFTESDVESSR